MLDEIYCHWLLVHLAKISPSNEHSLYHSEQNFGLGLKVTVKTKAKLKSKPRELITSVHDNWLDAERELLKRSVWMLKKKNCWKSRIAETTNCWKTMAEKQMLKKNVWMLKKNGWMLKKNCWKKNFSIQKYGFNFAWKVSVFARFYSEIRLSYESIHSIFIQLCIKISCFRSFSFRIEGFLPASHAS